MTLPARRRSLDSIQGLRGIAATLVVVYHLAKIELELGRCPTGLARPFLYFGAEGVDLFFTISGFIILWTNLDNFGDVTALPRYLARRVARIYPLYWLFFGFAIAMAVLGFSRALDTAGGAWNLVDIFFLLPIECVHIVPVSWTLTFEMFFYVFFGLAHLFRRRWFPWLLALWLVAIVGGYAVMQPDLEAHSRLRRIAEIVVNVRNVEFMSGCLLSLYLARRRLPLPWAAFAGGVAVFALGGVRLWHLDPESRASVWRPELILTFGVGSALIVGGAVGYELRRKTRFVPRWLVRLGDMSYSLYLSHLFAFAVLRRVLEPLNRTGIVQHTTWMATLLCGGLLSGWLTHCLVEKKIISAGNALINRYIGRRANEA